MAVLTATTELEAINTIIGTVGDSPLSTLEESTSVNAETAKSILHEVSREVQLAGWYFNAETEYPISPNINGEINVPVNVLSIDTSQIDASYDLVQRGQRMYDKKNHTYIINKTLKFDVIFFLAFTDLPEAARRYITVRAARVFADRQVNSEFIHQFSSNDENSARNMLLEDESRNADHNIFNSYDVFRVIDRNI